MRPGPASSDRLRFGARDRYDSAAEVQKFSGVAPVTESSGKMRWVHWRLACPSSCAKPFTNSPTPLVRSRSGRRLTTSSDGSTVLLTTPPSAPWLTSGFASSSVTVDSRGLCLNHNQEVQKELDTKNSDVSPLYAPRFGAVRVSRRLRAFPVCSTPFRPSAASPRPPPQPHRERLRAMF